MIVLLGAAALLSLPATLMPADCHAAPQPQTIAGAHSATYKSAGGQSLRRHLFLPRATEGRPAPAVLSFFGGGWRSGRIDQFVPQAKVLRDRGIVAVVVDYRVRCRQGTGLAEAIVDADDAVAWLRNHAARNYVDPRRIASRRLAGQQAAILRSPRRHCRRLRCRALMHCCCSIRRST